MNVPTRARQGTPRPPWVNLGAATLSATVGGLPVFLLGSLAVFIREDLHFGETALGAAASIYYLASAVASVAGGRLAERLGARRAIGVAASTLTVAVLGIAVLAHSWSALAAFMALAGLANALTQPATNLGVARGVDPRRQGLSFGIKQSNGPLNTLLAGLAVPALGLTVGWRWAFVALAVVALPLVIAGLRGPGIAYDRSAPRPTVSGRGALIMLSVAAAFAVVAGSSLGAFYVESAVAAGTKPALAGTVLAGGSVLGIAARIFWGSVGDRAPRRHFQVVALLLLTGAVGFALLGMGGGVPTLVVATLIALGMGWAWPGLFNFAVVTRSPRAPAAATGITGTGQFAGGIVGPLGFGLLVENSSYGVAWSAAAAAMVCAGFLALLGGRALDRSVAAEAAEADDADVTTGAGDAT